MRHGILAVVIGALLVPAIAQVRAQVPAAPTVLAPAVPPPAAPKLDDLEQGWLQIVALSEQLAYSECQRLETVQKFNATLAEVVKRLEEKHPGYTLDRAKGLLVPKGK